MVLHAGRLTHNQSKAACQFCIHVFSRELMKFGKLVQVLTILQPQASLHLGQMSHQHIFTPPNGQRWPLSEHPFQWEQRQIVQNREPQTWAEEANLGLVSGQGASPGREFFINSARYGQFDS